MESQVSVQRACVRLGIGRRRLRDLIQRGTLSVTGEGHQRRISEASLEAEIKRRRTNSESVVEYVAISGNPVSSLPDFFSDGVSNGEGKNETNNMQIRLLGQHDDVGDLLSIASAAATVGVSDRLLKQLIERGEIPSVLINNRRRINRQVLRQWARGEMPKRRL